jgi:DNA-binding transcriptional MocR family regulator
MQQQNRIAFFIIPETVAATKTLSSTAKLLLARLMRHRNRQTGQCNPRRVTLAAELGVSESTITRALRELRLGRFIESHKGQRGNSYTLQIPAASNPQGAPGQIRPAEAPYPLYETLGLNKPPSRKNFSTPIPAVARKPVRSQGLECYYAKQRRKAGG